MIEKHSIRPENILDAIDYLVADDNDDRNANLTEIDIARQEIQSLRSVLLAVMGTLTGNKLLAVYTEINGSCRHYTWGKRDTVEFTP